MDNENHKSTWNNFTKFVLWGTVAVIAVLVLMAYSYYKFSYENCFSLENQKLKKELQSHQKLQKNI